MYTWIQRLKESLRIAATDSEEHAVPFIAGSAPVRLFNDQQFREHARRLAAAYPIVTARADDHLAERLADHENALDHAFDAARNAVSAGRAVEPAVEWLIDNFYLIKEQIQEVRAGLPRSYLRELPTVAGVDGIKSPRILMLARELVLHSDGRRTSSTPIRAEPA